MASTPQIPHLRATATSKQLIVNGKPFLILGGELQNSSFSSVEYMNEVWPNLVANNYNAILGSVGWEQVEPVEGTFDFAVLDAQIEAARRWGLRIILLWFGSFKNGLSSYAPAWVKQDNKRFPRTKLRSSKDGLITGDVLSVFGEESMAADARAFTQLMRHLKKIDGDHATVIMVQVENEVGVLGDSRDRSAAAEEAFNAAMPADMIQFLNSDWSTKTPKFQANFKDIATKTFSQDMSWASLGGPAEKVGELFMAYHYAHYLEHITSAGKTQYPLPMYTNVWQNYADEDADMNAPTIAGGGNAPGDYPSGGGVIDVLDIWQTFAPSLDIIAPDIYLNNYTASCAKYRHNNQVLFIPEQRRDEYGALRVWAAFGSYQCIGTAPFGVDTVNYKESPLTATYALLAKVSRHILTAQAKGYASVGFFFDEVSADGTDTSEPVTAAFGPWNLTIERSFVFGKPAAGAGMVIYLDDKDQFLLIGFGFQVSFESSDLKAHFTGILKFEECDVEDYETGELRTVRLLNGDETRSGKSCVMPNVKPDYGGFPISITIPGRTGIAMCQPYALLN
ncbi:beta-galactosidase [Aureobasidium sp. EXF-10727]|nr:beta-galactosidase [Aureobasidium sp. EXF-10727]